ncbi:hypothetical protein HDV00_008816 [Rhizophlyctis rosea]|nr:hypothetical protein HDV00_008816 [Rhizophlyctis rosea]
MAKQYYKDRDQKDIAGDGYGEASTAKGKDRDTNSNKHDRYIAAAAAAIPAVAVAHHVATDVDPAPTHHTAVALVHLPITAPARTPAPVLVTGITTLETGKLPETDEGQGLALITATAGVMTNGHGHGHMTGGDITGMKKGPEMDGFQDETNVKDDLTTLQKIEHLKTELESLKSTIRSKGMGWEELAELEDQYHVKKDEYYGLVREDELTRGLEELLRYLQPTASEARIRAQFIQDLTAAIQQVDSRATLHVVGSYATGIYLPDADLDFVITDPDSHHLLTRNSQLSKEKMKEGLTDYAKFFRRNPKATHVEFRQHARIPIIKFYSSTLGIECDIAYGQEDSRNAARIVNELLGRIPLMRELALLIKLFIHIRKWDDPPTGGLGGYPMAIWAASFITQYRAETHIQNPTLGALFLAFLRYYGKVFDYRTMGISITGEFRKRDKNMSGDALVILDPNNAANNCARTVTGRTLDLIEGACEDSYGDLRDEGLGELERVVEITEDMRRFRRALVEGWGGSLVSRRVEEQVKRRGANGVGVWRSGRW